MKTSNSGLLAGEASPPPTELYISLAAVLQILNILFDETPPDTCPVSVTEFGHMSALTLPLAGGSHLHEH